MRPEIYFADIIVSYHSVVSGVGSVVGSHVVQRAASGKSYSRFQTLLRSQFSIVVLQSLADISQPLPRFDDTLGKSSHLPVDVGCLSQILKGLIENGLLCFQLLVFDSGHLVLLDFVCTVA